MHVERTETGALEVVGHLDLPVDALLAQDRHLGPRTGRHERRGHVFGRVEHQLRTQSRRLEVARLRALLVGGFRVVTQFLHGVRHRPPGVEQGFPTPLGQYPTLPAHADARRAGGACDALRALGQRMPLDQISKRGAVLAGDLHHRTQFFVEQAAERIIAPGIEGDVQALPRGERHLAQRRKRTAIAAVVIRQQQATLARRANQFKEAAQPLRIVQIRHLAAERRQCRSVGIHLRQHRTAQTLLAATQPDQPQLALFVAAQQRRQLRAHIADRRECTDDQRDR